MAKENLPILQLTEIAQQSSWDDSITPDREMADSRIKMLIKAIIRIDSVSYGHCTVRMRNKFIHYKGCQ